MNLTKQVGLCGGALALSLSGAALAGGEELNNDELKSRLLAAEAKIAELEAQNNDNWLTEQRSDEIRSLVNDVLADADTRASLLQSGMTAGYDNGFVISSSDGNWLLRVNGQLQTRFIVNDRDADADTGAASNATDKYRWGFENSRTKLIFTGHVVNPSWTYKIEGNFAGAQDELLTTAGAVALSGSSDYGEFNLQDAWIHWDYGNGWGVRVGQFKTKLLREFSVFSGNQLAVERSNTSYVFGTGRTQGVEVTYNSDAIRGWASFNDGPNAENTPWSVYDTEFSIDSRIDWLLSGTWEQMEDFTSPAGDETGIMIGGGIGYSKSEYGTTLSPLSPSLPGTGVPADNEQEIFTATVDVQAEFGGFNAFGSFIYRNTSANDSALFPDTDQFGFVLQGGWCFSDDWELYGRYEYLDLDTGPNDTQSLLTIGVNRYFSGHNLKWTTDWVYSFDEVLVANPITGLRPDTAGANQWAIRTQLQLMF
jgi:hypothetical protein